MSINLDSKEGRKKFITDNLTDLMSAVNDTYGPILLEELLKRIDRTISDFNEEITDAFKRLKSIDKKRQEAFSKIEFNDENFTDDSKTEWEKKLDERESK
tara:strand:+ start:601 stop:900 length:300 start_codon:yes stop_codon:yes gene_type:complete